MLQRVLLVVLSVVALACHRQMLGGSTAVAGDGPGVNQMTSARQKVPFCPGGDKAKACFLGENCRVTEKGCQVCQCQTPE